MESLIQLNDGVTVDLSEQYLVSCNSDGWGCNGGLWAHDYHQKWIYYYVNVPENASDLQIEVTGGSGDIDLYTQLGSVPTISSYDCRPYLDGNEESCSYTSPDAGKWYIGIHGYKEFSGVSLTVTHD